MKSPTKGHAQQEEFKVVDKKDFPSDFKKEFCNPKRIKEIAKDDAQGFINKKSRSDFEAFND